MLVVGGIGISYGKPQRLVYGTDYKGRTCGVDSAVKDKRYTVYPRTTEDFLVNVGKRSPLDYKFYGVCAERCPGKLDVVCNDDRAELGGAAYTQAALRACLEGGSSSSDVDCALARAGCWVTPQATSSTFFRCIPVYNITGSGVTTCVYPPNVTSAGDPACVLAETVTGTTVQRPARPNMLFDQMNTGRQLWGRWFGDLARAWWVVLACSVGLAVTLGFVFTLFLKYFTGCMVWTTIVLVVLGLAALDIYFYFKGGLISWDLVPDNVEAQIKAALPAVTLPSLDSASGRAVASYLSALVPDSFASSQWDAQQAWRIIAYVTSAVVVVVLCVVVFLRTAISTAIRVIKLGANAMRQMPLMLAFPPLASLGYAAFLLWWIFVAASLATSGTLTTQSLAGDINDGVSFLTAKFNNTLPDSLRGVVASATIGGGGNLTHITDVPVAPYLLIYHFFGLLWITQFHNGVVAMTVAGAVCAWYFSQNEGGAPDVEARRYPKARFPLCRALGRTLRYYLGSVAFGSLLIAFIQFVRTVFAYIQRRLQKGSAATGGPGPAVKFALCCIQCCLKCMQVLVEMVTRNAYIYVALKGVSFCAAGRRVFGLLTQNAATLVMVNVLSEVLMFIAKVGIACACGWGCFVLLENVPRFRAGGADEITSTWLLVLVTMFFAYSVASTFMALFDLTVDTVLVCFVTDCDENQQRGGRWAPVHVTASPFDAATTKGGGGKEAPPSATTQVAPSRGAGAAAAGGGGAVGPRLV